ncbi:hypothetical protein SFBM_1024 [Candidatus Arthromitus sp. SFB-mouse-Japan]|uniref:DUF1659 domain-containing protein n=1 Tax=Candidatus Arthromitus sp. SFB-mouse TaxID=49118 RepID=UPI00021B7EAC|nr:hypothetical protein [Candidatus Arthromitus sp. SFB-mouse]EIA23569.1 hypothetical protein SFB2_147G4 [Candidatus Arthromitus sp. SFB-2]EIA29320.1 hypothetical protein SFB4_074G1 [Candidatus Arthromitus sp. SFB-4]EIA31063.1 hypothetical protein SFBSU_006G744 [Candidatus Arthromitus sp. SFB-mouse-SU]EIA31638.1 hypothetical protein SFB5_015G1 [Candidatus Arthromitus sp. SFB-5]EGX28525.1 hypothetical protein SFBNYU_005450 [Candidatus Arthromitus sp. SFB-mouse-NYU]
MGVSNLFNTQVITSTTLATSLVITFYTDNLDGTVRKFTRTIADIKSGLTNDILSAAARAVAELVDHTRYDVKLVTTNLIEDGVTD